MKMKLSEMDELVEDLKENEEQHQGDVEQFEETSSKQSGIKQFESVGIAIG